MVPTSLLPEAATSTRPAAAAAANAVSAPDVVPSQCQLMLTTLAPLAVAQLIAETMSASELMKPFCSSLIGMTLQFQPTPAAPSPLLVAAAARLAQHVPWPKSSLGVLVPATTSRR